MEREQGAEQLDAFHDGEQESLTMEEMEDLKWPTVRSGWSTYWINRLGPLSTSILRIEAEKIFEKVHQKARAMGVINESTERQIAKHKQSKQKKLAMLPMVKNPSLDIIAPVESGLSMAPVQERATNDSETKKDDLWRLLMEGVTKRNSESRIRAKKRYQRDYPDQLERIEVIFELPEYLNIQQTLDRQKELQKDPSHRFDRKTSLERKRMFEEIVQYQFLITNFILQNSGDKEFCAKLWDFGDKIAWRRGQEQRELIDRLRRSVLSQVAAFRIMEHLGGNPQLSAPKEDAFSAIDMWAHDAAIQIKGTPEDKPAILETKIMAFPAIEAHDDDGNPIYVNAFLTENFSKFKVKLADYLKRFNAEEPTMIQGFLLAIPYSQFDPNTGEPSEEIVQYFADNL